MTESRYQDQIFTVGHSNHSAEHFQELLAKHSIEVLVDVRSWPHSRYVKWADAGSLPDVVRGAGARYLFLGQELGGRPEEPDFYDAEDHVLYAKVATDPRFHSGIGRLRQGARRYRVALMCSEENPANCHRRLLVAKVLLEQGVGVCHIRGDGSCEAEPGPIDLCAGSLLDDEETLWRSSLSVSRARPRRISSAA